MHSGIPEILTKLLRRFFLFFFFKVGLPFPYPTPRRPPPELSWCMAIFLGKSLLQALLKDL